MATIVMQRQFDPPLSVAGFRALALEAADCMQLYRADWHESFMARDGSKLFCCFSAPDAESIRMMTRGDASRHKTVWPGSVHDSAQDGPVTVVVERSFDEPVEIEALQTIEDAGAACLQTYRVSFLRSYFAADRKRMICLYRAPDAESVRRAQAEAGMPVDHIWACRHFTPDNLFDSQA